VTADITIILPIYIRMGKKKADRFSLNLNTYRNAHFHILNQAKGKFEQIVASRIGHLPTIARTDLTYTLFFGSKRAIDIANICCIVDKFFSDTLVSQKKLIDDNMSIISDINYRWGGVDKLNPRVEVTLSNIQTIEEPMQIILTQQEVEEAIRDTISQQITIREDQGIAINFSGVKGEFQVIVTIQKLDETSPKKVRTRRASPADADPVEEPAKAHVVTEGDTVTVTLAQPVFATQPVDSTTREPASTSRIFPDVNSSAPVTEPASPTPSKSLFANLTKPVHDTAAPQE